MTTEVLSPKDCQVLMNMHSFQVEYRPGDTDSICETVVRVVSVATGKEPAALDPLFWTIDPEDAAALFRGRPDPASSLAFDYEGCEVTVRADGEVTVSVSGT